LSTAAAGVVAGLAGAAYKAVTLSDDLNTLAKQTGFSTSELQKMTYAADRIDVSMEDITGAAAKLKRNMTSTSASVTAAFDRIGVSARDANGNLRNSTEVFWDVIGGLSNIADETERDTVAMALFGKSADELAGIVDDGGVAFRQLGSEAESLGLILGQDTLDGLNVVNDQLDKVKAQAQSIIAINGAKVIEAFLPLIQEAAEGAGAFADKLANVDTETIKTVASIAAVVAGISPVASLISNVSGAVSALTPVVGSLFALISAHPLGAALTATAALTAAVVAATAATKDAKSGTDQLTTSAQALGTTIDDAKKKYDEESTSIQQNWQKGGLLLDRLKALETQTNRTAAEEYERKVLVDELNGIYPDLNLSIDENTGNLNMNTEAIRHQIAAMRDQAIQQALQEKYNTILSAMADAQIEVYDNQLKLRDATATYNDAAQRNADLTAQLKAAEAEQAAALADLDKGVKGAADRYNEATEKVGELAEAQALAESEATVWAAEMDKLSAAIEDGQAAVESYASEYESAVSGISSILRSAGESAGANYGEGLARGIASKRARVVASAEELARGVIHQGNRTLEIASPSKVARQQGEYWDEGLALGLTGGRKAVTDAADDVSQLVIDSAPGVVNNTTNNTTSNMGGVYVTVNGAPGQDVQQLAEAVMEEIQAAVERESAAL
jgi:predicted  nucleic acid-binding Zn-ribbon protein